MRLCETHENFYEKLLAIAYANHSKRFCFTTFALAMRTMSALNTGGFDEFHISTLLCK